MGDEPYYPVNDEKNGDIICPLSGTGSAEDKVIFGGRLGAYRYYDMDKVIEAALELVFNIFDDLVTLSTQFTTRLTDIEKIRYPWSDSGLRLRKET